MQYIDSFTLPSGRDEDGYYLSFPPKIEMSCYEDNIYPFKIFPQKELRRLDFEPLTLIYGGNGSGKSTLLNVIAQKLSLDRTAPFNSTPHFSEYLNFCRYRLTRDRELPSGSRIITSDDVFDSLLTLRAHNDGVDRQREELFDEYDEKSKYFERTGRSFLLKSLDDYDEFASHVEAKSRSKSEYTSHRLTSREIRGHSNGESAYAYFTLNIKENALYLLDEPENSLSARLQVDLAAFLENSARFYGCQFIISTHSPFLLAMKGAKIYDLDISPAQVRKWTELENVRYYHDFFESRRGEF